MTFSSKNNLSGFPQPFTRVFPAPIISARSPLTSDFHYPIGQMWIDTTGDDAYVLVDVTANSATWVVAASSPGEIATLTGDNSTAISPSAGNVNLLGTANQITTTGSGSTITWSLPSAITAPGSLATTSGLTAGTTFSATGGASTFVGTFHANITGAAATVIGTGGTGTVQIGNATGNTAVTGSLTASTTLTATLGAITATNGNLVLGTAGNKIASTSVASTTTGGANSFGTVALVGGTATVATTAVTASSMIFLTCQALGTVAVAKAMAVTAKTASTSFVITSADATDTSTVAWFIVN